MNDIQRERVIWGALLWAGSVLLLDWLLARVSGLQAPRALAVLALLTVIQSALVALRLRLRRQADDERRATELAAREGPATGLFATAAEEDAADEPFSAERGRVQFERFFVPAAAPLLALIGLGLAWGLRRGLAAPPEPVTRNLLVAGLLATQSFVSFLYSRYLFGLSRETAGRWLRGPAIHLGLICLAGLAGLGGALAAEYWSPQPDRIIAWGLLGGLVLLALENLLFTIGHIYRPRRVAAEPACPYESRLFALLTDPGAWVRSIAQALDYQFGFQVSNTWFYRFLARDLAPLLLFQLAVLYALSCFVFIAPEETALRERFGRLLDPVPGRGLLEPGAHLKAPWPFETIRRFPARRILTFNLGLDRPIEELPRTLTWTTPHHGQKENFLTASRQPETAFQGDPADVSVPVNLISVHVPVEYHITNLVQYAYGNREPDRILRQIGYQTLTREAAAADLFDFVGAGQLERAAALRARMQAQADEWGLGVEITFVGLQGVHPPMVVADAFEAVVGALEEREALILNARAYGNRVLPLSRAEADRLIEEATAYRVRRSVLAAAEAERFGQRLEGFQISPAVYRLELYLRSLRTALADARKFIVVAAPAHEVVQFDFLERPSPELFFEQDLSAPTGRGL